MDAATYPHGVLEEVEAGQNEVQEPAEAGGERKERRYIGKFEKRLLANCQQPYSQRRPIQ